MATQTFSRAQSVITTMRCSHVARAGVARAVQVVRPSQTAVFGPSRSIAARGRRSHTVSVSANGNGLSIDLRGARPVFNPATTIQATI